VPAVRELATNGELEWTPSTHLAPAHWSKS
jgi:hypothetical protein